MRNKWCITILMFLSFPAWLFAQTSVTGRVAFDGTPPPPEQVEVKSDMATCGTTQEVRHLILGQDNGVANAVVTIVGAKAEGALASKDGVLDQVNCEFVPHVQALPVGSTLKITSSDPVLHNSHGFHEDGSTAFNIAVPIPGMELPAKLKEPGVIKLRCDAGHTWMSAYVVVTDQPFYAVTDADGNFSIEDIPPGSYEIEVWHEWVGKHREPITVQEGGQPVTITLKKS